MARFSISRGPRALFFKQEQGKLATLVRATIAPEEEEDFKGVTEERAKIDNEETNRPSRDNKFEGSLTKLGDHELRSKIANGCLKEDTNVVRRETELGTAKSTNQRERREVKARFGRR